MVRNNTEVKRKYYKKVNRIYLLLFSNDTKFKKKKSLEHIVIRDSTFLHLSLPPRNHLPFIPVENTSKIFQLIDLFDPLRCCAPTPTLELYIYIYIYVAIKPWPCKFVHSREFDGKNYSATAQLRDENPQQGLERHT